MNGLIIFDFVGITILIIWGLVLYIIELLH